MTTFEDVLRALDGLERAPPRPGLGSALAHCAQSIEMAIAGYPKPRAWIVRALIGPMVKRRFLRRSAMSHDVRAPIPGAPEIGDVAVAGGAARLRSAIAAFRAHRGAFADHFAYGPCTRDEYEALQSMHVADHLRATVP